ncbi:MAG TPA: S9 family peptidase [Terriglobales bacterium]|nr:S9 family peptidase [Terriglobales bacterium]
MQVNEQTGRGGRNYIGVFAIKSFFAAAIFIFAVLAIGSWAASPASSSDQRTVTDPHAVASPSNSGAVAVPVQDLYYIRSVFSPAWSPDGREIVFTTNLTGRQNLWKVSAQGGWPVQLVQSDDRQSGAVWSPDGKWIVYQQDFGGGAVYDLFAIPSAGGAPVNLTNTPAISETSPLWSPDGSQLAIEYKPRTSSTVDLALLNWKTHEIRKLTDESTKNHNWRAFAWSRDGKTIYAMRAIAGDTDADVYRVDIASGKAENLTQHEGQVIYAGGSVSPDGRTVLISSNERHGFSNIALLDVATKKLRWITDSNWDADPGDFSPDGKTFTYAINEDGRVNTYVADVATGHSQRVDFPEAIARPEGRPTSFSPNGKQMLVSFASSTRPADLWVYDLDSKRSRQLTHSAIASLNPATLPASQLVHYRSFDGMIISAFLWMPFNLKRDGSNPGLVLPHGGPTGQTMDTFNRTASALASRGYVCIAPNVRGSTGYGMAFQKANYQDLGGGDLQDEVYAAHFLVDTGYVDAKKMGITGGSYGGYMAMIAIGKTPDVWAAAVELYGVTDWLTEQKNEDPILQQYDQSILGDPVKDREVYERASPTMYFKNAKAPLLVLQGENDITDPKEEAEQVVNILQAQGTPVQAHYYPDEGHGFSKRENQIDAMRRTVEWFDKYLKRGR